MRVICLVRLGIALALVFLQLPAGAKTIYVEKWGGPAPGCGSKLLPCGGVSSALFDARRNDRIIVGPGSFTGNYDINVEGLRLESAHGPNVTILRANGGIGRIIGVNQRNIRIGRTGRGLTFAFANGSATASGVQEVSPQVTGTRVEGNVFISNNYGIWLLGENSLVRNNLLQDSGIAGIYVETGSQVQVRDNRIIQQAGMGIGLGSVASAIVQNNFISGANKGILVYSGSHGNRLLANAIVNGKGVNPAAIQVENVQGTRVDGNVATMGTWGVIAQQVAGGQIDPLYVVNNAVVANLAGIVLNSSVANVYDARIENNMGYSNAIYGVDIQGSARPSSIARNNLVGVATASLRNATATTLEHRQSFLGLYGGSPGIEYTAPQGVFSATSTEATRPNPFKAARAARMM